MFIIFPVEKRLKEVRMAMVIARSRTRIMISVAV